MSWKERLRQTIDFVSPEGNTFSALWQNNPRTMEKKLGIFQFPKVKGAKIQDLDVGAVAYPLTIFFEGPDNDIEAEKFFIACNEKGLWNITHPVKGELNLQLINVIENISPVDTGNITRFNTSWLDPATEVVQIATAFLKSSALSQVNDLNSISQDQLNNVSNIDKFLSAATFEKTVNDIVATVDKFLKPLYEKNSQINSQIESIKRGIDSAFEIPLDVLSLAGQVQELIQLPALIIEDINAKLDAYQNFLNAILNLSPETTDTENINIVSLQELALMSYVSAISFLVPTGELSNRPQTVEIINSISDSFNDIVNTLDASQELYEDQSIDLQYFSQSESFNNSALIIATVNAYLIKSIFDLAIEKRFKIDRPRTPLDITISEYGSLGIDDSNFQLFLDSNKLKNNDILILPSGREVVVYA